MVSLPQQVFGECGTVGQDHTLFLGGQGKVGHMWCCCVQHRYTPLYKGVTLHENLTSSGQLNTYKIRGCVPWERRYP